MERNGVTGQTDRAERISEARAKLRGAVEWMVITGKARDHAATSDAGSAGVRAGRGTPTGQPTSGGQ